MDLCVVALLRRRLLLSGVALGPMLVAGPLLAAPCVPTAQVIAAPSLSTIASDGGSIEITAAGRAPAVVADCPATSIDNAGTIANVVGGEASGLRVAAGVDMISNAGSIVGTTNGLLNTGTIQSTANRGFLGAGTFTSAGSGIANSGLLGEVYNMGTITGSWYGIANSGTITRLAGYGVITGGTIGLAGIGIANAGSIELLDNGGYLYGAGGNHAGGIGLLNGSVIDGLVNRGMIGGGYGTAGTVGRGIVNEGAIRTLLNQGTITGTSVIGANTGPGLLNTGSIGFLTNEGSIDLLSNRGAMGRADFSGTSIIDNRGVIGTVDNSGTVLSGGVLGLGPPGHFGIRPTIFYGIGVDNAGTVGMLSNSGLIGSGIYGVRNDKGTITSIQNTGSINGAAAGIWNRATLGRLDNAGTITGNAGVRNDAVFGTIANSGFINQVYNTGSLMLLSNTGRLDSVDNQGSLGSVSNTGSIGDVRNAGTLSGILNQATLASLSNTGSIGLGVVGPAGGRGAVVNTGVIASISNTGSIDGLGVSGALSGNGIANYGSIGRLESTLSLRGMTALYNSGRIDTVTIAGQVIGAAGVRSSNGSLVGGGTGIGNAGSIGTLDVRGTIAAYGLSDFQAQGQPLVMSPGSGQAIDNSGGTIGTLRNAGLIGGGSTGISNVRGSITTLVNTGTISGSLVGVSNSGSIGTLTNAGRIGRLLPTDPFSGFGLLNDGPMGRLENSGVLDGIRATAPIGQIINAGSIGASIAGGAAIWSSVPLGELVNTGTITGTIEVRGGSLVVSGAGGVLRGGLIDTPDGNVVFAAGSQMLRDNIRVQNGQGTVVNTAALILEQPVTITGNYLQPPAGRLVIVATTAGAGLLAVTGAAVMTGSTIEVRAANGLSAVGQPTTVVTAQGGIAGGAPVVLGGSASGLRYDPILGPTSLSVLATPALYGDLTVLGLSPSAAASAAGLALDAVRPPPGVPMNPAQAAVFGPLSVVPALSLPATLDQLGPSIYADSLSVNRATFRMVTGRVDARQAAWRDGLDTPRGPEVWVDGTGQFLRLNASATGPGYTASSGGVVAGADVVPWAGVLAGAAVAFSSQSASATNGASWRGDVVQAQIYGGLRAGPWFADAQFGGAVTEGTSRRPVSPYAVTATANLPGSGLGGGIRGGVRLDAGGWAVEPSIGVNGLLIQQGSAVETQGGPVGLSVGGARYGGVQSVASVRVSRRIALTETWALEPDLRLGVAYELGPVQARVSAGFTALGGPVFTVATPSAGRASLVAGLRASLDTGTPLRVFAGYDAAVMRNASAQAVTGGVSWTW